MENTNKLTGQPATESVGVTETQNIENGLNEIFQSWEAELKEEEFKEEYEPSVKTGKKIVSEEEILELQEKVEEFLRVRK